MLFQPPIPPRYTELPQDELGARIAQRKAEFGDALAILGHHYQQDDVIEFADFAGDSLKLAIIAAEQSKAEFVVFCGVHFMAESADILTSDQVKVILPDRSAGCSMADMADLDQLEEAWDFLSEAAPSTIVPITYVNSAATIKAFCGEHQGACCTSGNARLILEWAWRQGERVLFLPDQHLGRNTAYAMGVPLDQMAVYDPLLPEGGLSVEQARAARIILWKGYCSVHSLFTTAQCDEIRGVDPGFKIIVHPECPWDVVQKADLAGSTEFIIKTVGESPAGSKWAIGTEVHLVNRLTHRHPDKQVRSLAGIQCLCTTMYRIDRPHLLWVLDELADGRVVNQIAVPPNIARGAVLALDRMLANVSSQPISGK